MPIVWFDQGRAAASQGRVAEAEALFRHGLTEHPRHADAWACLGTSLLDQGRHADAQAALRRGLQCCGEHAGIYNNLAQVLRALGRDDEAAQVLTRALQIDPSLLLLYSNLGSVLANLHRMAEAEAVLQQGLLRNLQEHTGGSDAWRQLCPSSVRDRWMYQDTQRALAHVWLLQGRYQEAWPLYEQRRAKQQDAPIAPPLPEWLGEDLQGRSIVVIREQGLGDELMFVRYLPCLKQRGASRVVFWCKPELYWLLQDIDGADRVIAQYDGQAIPAADCWTLLMSLPWKLGGATSAIPVTLPYLHATQEMQHYWASRLPPARLRVGLAWKSHTQGHAFNEQRSLPGLPSLAPLWHVPGVLFVNLLNGFDGGEVRELSAVLPMYEASREALDFASVAGLIAQLDLVISIDTSLAHLAAAMSKPCWIMLSLPETDWRWQLEREDSPWYPGVVRLFRQSHAQDWDGVVERVRVALASL